MSTARRVAARYLEARRVPLTAERIRQVQQEAEIFAANAEAITNETDHARVQQAAYAWRNASKPLYGEAMKFVTDIADNMPDRKKAERLVSTWRSKFAPLFEVVLTVGSFPDWGPYWPRMKPDWVRKVRAEVQGLDGVIKYLRTLAKAKTTPMVHQLTTEGRTVEGFHLILVEYDAEEPKQVKAFEIMREALKLYRRRARETLPLLLKLELPFRVDFSAKHSLFGMAGNYGGTSIDINPYSPQDPKTLSKTLAHEMGHHVYRVWLTEQQRSFWRGALAKDWTELDLTDVLAAWKSRPAYWAAFEVDLQKTDPILYLQLSGAHNYSKVIPKELQDEGWSVENLERYLSNGGKRKIRVPASPITGYAVANPEEAFCEAVAMLVAYGPRAVLPLVRSWLGIILEGQVKLASGVEPQP